MKLDDIRRLAAAAPYPPTDENYSALRRYMREAGMDPDSLYQELEMSSRYVDTHRDISFSNTTVQLHSHTFYEIICCRSSCAAEYLVGTERYAVEKGDIIFVPPMVSHRPILPDPLPEPYVRDVVWISTELVESAARFFSARDTRKQLSTSFLRTAGTGWEYICELIRAGIREAEVRAPDWEGALIGNTIALMAHLKRAFLDKSAPSLSAEEPELPDRAAAYIEANLGNKITLEDAARHLYVSESTLTQAFRRKMGVSFYRFVTQRRLIAAKSLILKGTLLEQVAAEVGFSDYSSFYRAFRQEYGISPRQYRRLQQGSEAPPL